MARGGRGCVRLRGGRDDRGRHPSARVARGSTRRARGPGRLCEHESGALRLLEATGEAQYLQRAAAWTKSCIRHFADPSGGFFHTADNVPHLVARIRDGHDGATPSGNGIMARVLSELFLSTGDTLYRRAAQELFESFATDFERDGFLLASIIDAAQFNARAVQVTSSPAATIPPRGRYGSSPNSARRPIAGSPSTSRGWSFRRGTRRVSRLPWAADRRPTCARGRPARCRSPTPTNWRGG